MSIEYPRASVEPILTANTARAMSKNACSELTAKGDEYARRCDGPFSECIAKAAKEGLEFVKIHTGDISSIEYDGVSRLFTSRGFKVEKTEVSVIIKW